MERKLLIVTFLLVGIIPFMLAQSDYKIPKLRISASGGLGYLTATGETNMDVFINKEKINQFNNSLRWATHMNGDIHYYLRPGIGFGFKYIFHKTSAAVDGLITGYMEVTDYLNQPHYTVTDIWENDYVNFLGPSVSGIYVFGNNYEFKMIASFSTGYMWWRSEYSILYQNFLATSANVAMNTDIGLDYMFHRNLGIGVNMGSFLGFISNVKLTDGINAEEQTLDKDSRVNVSNINLSFGLRYYMNR